MAIRSSLYLSFDSKLSTEFGIVNVNINSGMLEEPFMANRQINEVKIKGRDKPYFGTTTHDPLSFTLTLAFKDGFDSDKLRSVARWLSTTEYKPLFFSDNTDRIYYAQLDNESKISHTGAGNGYITLTMRTNSPFSYSPVYESKIFDLSNNPVGGTIISINNIGDISIRPEVYIKKIGLGDSEIINLSNSGTSFKFTSAITDPTVAPVMSQVANASSTLPAGTYYGRYTYAGITGETMISPETMFVLSSGYNLMMTIPTLPTNAGQSNAYIGTASGSGKIQGNTITTTYTQSVPLVAGLNPPAANTSGIKNLENIYVDNDAEMIISDQTNPTVYRFVNFNNSYLELIYGVNNLLVKGNMILRIRYQCIFLQG